MSAPQGPPAPPPSQESQPPYQSPPYGGPPSAATGSDPSGPSSGSARTYPPPAFVPSPKPERVTEGPEIGLPPGVAIADLGPRVLSWLIEAGIPIVFGLLLLIVINTSDSLAAPLVFAIISAIVNIGWIVFLGWRYTTEAAGPGTKLMQLQLVGMEDGRPLGWGRWLPRYLLFAVLTALSVVNVVFWVFLVLNPRRQGWHDQAVGSVLIKERALAPRPATSAASPAALGPAEPEPTAGLVGGPHYGPVTRSYGSSASSASEPAPAVGAWTVRIDDREQTVRGLVLLGRNPQPAAGEEGVQIVKIRDEHRTVSKTHLALGTDEQGLYVVDRGSTNGSAATSPDGVHRLLTAGEPVRLGPGWTVAFGRHTITVERPD